MERGVCIFLGALKNPPLLRDLLEARGQMNKLLTPHVPPSLPFFPPPPQWEGGRQLGQPLLSRQGNHRVKRAPVIMPGGVGVAGGQPCGPQPTHCLAVWGVAWGAHK